MTTETRILLALYIVLITCYLLTEALQIKINDDARNQTKELRQDVNMLALHKSNLNCVKSFAVESTAHLLQRVERDTKNGVVTKPMTNCMPAHRDVFCQSDINGSIVCNPCEDPNNN